MGFAAAVGALGCQAGPSSGAVELQRQLLELFGHRHCYALGIYNCRRQAGPASPWSLHAEGRAIDLGVRAGYRDVGDEVLHDLRALADGVLQRIIWFRKVYDLAAPEGRPYAGPNPHEDHLHIELSWPAARGEMTIALPDDTDSEDEPMPNLIVAYKGAQWCVSPDLSTRVGLPQSTDVTTLLRVNAGRSYVPAVLSESLMQRIPEVRP